jgi:hypothetical protein
MWALVLVWFSVGMVRSDALGGYAALDGSEGGEDVRGADCGVCAVVGVCHGCAVGPLPGEAWS